MRFPITLLEFQAQFLDEASCWAYLRQTRWPQGFRCSRCGGRGSHSLAARRLEQCRSCRYQGSVTAGPVFHGTRVALRDLGIDHRPRKGGHGRQSVHRLPWAHTVFGNLKTWLRGTFHGVSPKHLQRYLDEFVFRFDRRWRETELFIRVLHRALDTAPCPYHQLTAERIG